MRIRLEGPELKAHFLTIELGNKGLLTLTRDTLRPLTSRLYVLVIETFLILLLIFSVD